MTAPSDRTTISANVTPSFKAELEARAEAEDRPPSFVVRRALRLYLWLPVAEADRLLAGGTPGE